MYKLLPILLFAFGLAVTIEDTSYNISQDTTSIGQIPSESGSVSVLKNVNKNSWPHYQLVFISFNIGFNGINYNELTNTLIENEFDDLKPEIQISDNLPLINDFISNPKVHMGFEITGYPTKLMLAGLKWNFLSEHSAKNNNLKATLKSHFVYADIGIGLNRHNFSITPLSIGMGALFNKLEFKRGINPSSFDELINEFSINEEITQDLFIINFGSRLDFHFWPKDDYFFNVGVKVNYLVSPIKSKWKYGENKKLTSKPAIFTNNPTIEISIGVGGMSD